jgi:hypothetical protein
VDGVSPVDPDPAESPTEWLIDLAGSDPAIDAELERRLRLLGHGDSFAWRSSWRVARRGSKLCSILE